LTSLRIRSCWMCSVRRRWDVSYRGAQIACHALEGVLYRNTALVEEAPQTFDELALADVTMPAGKLGAFLERGAFFSLANLEGLGGRWMDANFNPTFNSDAGLAWLDLLADYTRAGGATFNNESDLNLFKDGRIGFIIDGTWNLRSLAEAIGPENLAIDPWPALDEGRMAGLVQSDCAYLNSNSVDNEQYAALVFMGYLLDRNVQRWLAEVENIPAVIDAQPRDVHFQQAMLALAGGIATPALPNADYWYAYLDALDTAIADVFARGVDPAVALQTAYDTITARLAELRGTP
jgi:maltose-binding protein MalE